MTDQRLHDLLHETVADASGPDVADLAWRNGARARRTRRGAVLAGATAAAVAVAALVGTIGRGDLLGPEPTGPVTPSSDAPDSSFHGVPVWWAPTLAQESHLPTLPDNPLPEQVDLSTPAPALATHPLRRALAAYAVVNDAGVQRVLVLGPRGQYRTVDMSSVKPMTDPEGNQRVRVGPSMLSPRGTYLMFPQPEGIRLLDLATGEWRWLYTQPLPSTWDAVWAGPRRILVPGRGSFSYSIAPDAPGNSLSGEHVAALPGRGSQTYGAFRVGNGVARSYYAGARIPSPPRLGLQTGQSEWIGIAALPSILAFPPDAGRQKGCCRVDAWQGTRTLLFDSSSRTGTRVLAWRVGTHSFWQVTRLKGITLGQQYAVSSYADQR